MPKRSLSATSRGVAAVLLTAVLGLGGGSESVRAQGLPGMTIGGGGGGFPGLTGPTVPAKPAAPADPAKPETKASSPKSSAKPGNAKTSAGSAGGGATAARGGKSGSANKGTAAQSGKPQRSAAAAPAGARAGSTGGAQAASAHSIAVLVNDEPITNYEIAQRARLLAMSTNVSGAAQAQFKRLVSDPATNARLKAILDDTIRSNQGKSREQIIAIFEKRKQEFARGLQQRALEGARATVLPQMRKQAAEELIEERLKLQEAKRLNIEVDAAQADEVIGDIARKNNMTLPQFTAHIKGLGGSVDAMRDRFRASIAWSTVVRMRFRALVAVNDRQVDTYIGGLDGEDKAELKLHRITLPVAATLEQAALTRQFAAAEALRRAFKGCGSSAALAKQSGARFEDLGKRSPEGIAEPTRSLLLNAKEGEILPPNLGQGGIELYVVCGRAATVGSADQREKVQRELEAKEFDVLARRHLADLRRDAHIEWR